MELDGDGDAEDGEDIKGGNFADADHNRWMGRRHVTRVFRPESRRGTYDISASNPHISRRNCWLPHGPPLDADTSPGPGSLPS